MRRPDAAIWEAVAQKELGMIRDMGVYSLTCLLPGRKAIGSRFVFEFKINSENLIPKVRLVAKGFHQISGVDFGKTFAPVAKAATIRMISAMACRLGWHLECFDVTRAFLWGELKEELYMKLPDGFVLPSDTTFPPGFLKLVWRLWQSIYGLKQASQVWYEKLKGVLMSLGLTMSEADHALFMFHGRWREVLAHAIAGLHRPPPLPLLPHPPHHPPQLNPHPHIPPLPHTPPKNTSTLICPILLETRVLLNPRRWRGASSGASMAVWV
jgi:hypothetical protein